MRLHHAAAAGFNSLFEMLEVLKRIFPQVNVNVVSILCLRCIPEKARNALQEIYQVSILCLRCSRGQETEPSAEDRFNSLFEMRRRGVERRS